MVSLRDSVPNSYGTLRDKQENSVIIFSFYRRGALNILQKRMVKILRIRTLPDGLMVQEFFHINFMDRAYLH